MESQSAQPLIHDVQEEAPLVLQRGQLNAVRKICPFFEGGVHVTGADMWGPADNIVHQIAEAIWTFRRGDHRLEQKPHH